MSASNIYVKQAHFETKSFIAPCAIVFHRSLSDAAIRLILAFQAVDTCTKNWVIRQCDMQKRLGWGTEKIRNAIKECVKFGYMQVRQSRESGGKFSRNDFDFDINASFLDTVENASTDTFQPLGVKPSTVEPCTENQALPMTKTITNLVDKQGNDCAEKKPVIEKALTKALPFTPEKSKFPLKQDQIPVFDRLKTLGLECEDSLLFLIIRTSTQSLIYDCIEHLRFEIEKGTQFAKGKIAFFRACLKGKISLMTEQAKRIGNALKMQK